MANAALQQSWEDLTHVAEVIRRVQRRRQARDFQIATLQADNESLRKRLQLARAAIVELTTKGK